MCWQSESAQTVITVEGVSRRTVATPTSTCNNKSTLAPSNSRRDRVSLHSGDSLVHFLLQPHPSVVSAVPAREVQGVGGSSHQLSGGGTSATVGKALSGKSNILANTRLCQSQKNTSVLTVLSNCCEENDGINMRESKDERANLSPHIPPGVNCRKGGRPATRTSVGRNGVVAHAEGKSEPDSASGTLKRKLHLMMDQEKHDSHGQYVVESQQSMEPTLPSPSTAINKKTSSHGMATEDTVAELDSTRRGSASLVLLSAERLTVEELDEHLRDVMQRTRPGITECAIQVHVCISQLPEALGGLRRLTSNCTDRSGGEFWLGDGNGDMGVRLCGPRVFLGKGGYGYAVKCFRPEQGQSMSRKSSKQARRRSCGGGVHDAADAGSSRMVVVKIDHQRTFVVWEVIVHHHIVNRLEHLDSSYRNTYRQLFLSPTHLILLQRPDGPERRPGEVTYTYGAIMTTTCKI